MIPIPKEETSERKRLIEEHAACIESMKGVAGCSVLRCQDRGDTTELTGGIHEDKLLAKVLLRMRAQPAKDKLVILCTEIDKEWRIGRLSGVRGVPPAFVNNKVYLDENEIKHDIFLLRLQEMSETDGMPEHFNEGWKRHADNWAST